MSHFIPADQAEVAEVVTEAVAKRAPLSLAASIFPALTA
jgi:hypothetical protein